MRSLTITTLIAVLLLGVGCGEDPERLMGQANIAMDNGRPDLALENARKILKQDANHIDALLLKSDAHMRLGQTKTARQSIERALDAMPGSDAAHVKMADWALAKMARTIGESEGLFAGTIREDYDGAAAIVEKQSKWLGDHGYDSQVLYIDARLHEMEARRLRAVRERLIAQEPVEGDASGDLSRGPEPAVTVEALASDDDDDSATDQEPSEDEQLTLEEIDKRIAFHFAKATDQLSELVKKDATHFDAATMYIGLLVQLERWEDVWDFGKVLQTRENLPSRLPYQMVIALIAMPDSVRPLDDRLKLAELVRLQTLNTSRKSLHWRMGGARMYIAADNWTKAQDLLEKVYKAHPGHSQAIYLLAACHYNAERYDQAEDLLFRLSSRMNDSFDVQSLYGQTLLKTRNFPAAKRALDNARRVKPDDEATTLAWMRVAAHLGHFYEAEDEINAFFQSNPDDLLAITLKIQLDRSKGDRDSVRKLLARLESEEELDEAHVLALMEGYRFLEEYDKVTAYAKQLRQAQPDSVSGQLVLVESLLAQNRDDDAERLLEEMRSQSPDDPAVNFLTSQYLLHRHRFAEAAPILKQLVESQPRDELLKISLAQALAGLGDNEQALTLLEEVLEQSPSNVHARALAIKIYQLTRRQDRVAEHLHQIDRGQLSENDWPGLLAQVKLNDGDLVEAERIAADAVARGVNDPMLRMILAAMDLSRHDIDAAAQHYFELLETQSSSPQAFQLYARFCAANNRVDEGIEKLKAFAEEQPTLTALATAGLLSSKQRNEEIFKLLEPVLEKELTGDGRFAVTTAGTLANAYAESGKADEAVGVFDRVIAASPTEPKPRLAQIAMLRRLGRNDAAGKKLDELAGKVDASNTADVIPVINLYLQISDRSGALAVLDRLIDAHPKQGEFIRIRGRLLLEQGEFDRAMSSFERALNIDSNDLVARKGLAQVHIAKRDYPAAESVYLQMAGLGREGRVFSLAGLGRMFLMLGLNDKAASMYKQLERFSPPRNPTVLLDIAKAYIDLGNDQFAFDRLAQIERFAPQYGEAQALMAQIEIRRKNLEAAGNRLRDLMTSRNASDAIAPVMVQLSLDVPANLDLLRWFDATVGLEDLSPRYRLLWGSKRYQMHAHRGDWSSALSSLEELIAVIPPDAARDDPMRLPAMQFVLLTHQGDLNASEALYRDTGALGGTVVGRFAALAIGRQPQADSETIGLADYVAARATGDLAEAKRAAQSLPPYPTIFRTDLVDDVSARDAGSQTDQVAHRRLALAMMAWELQLQTLAEEICRQVIADRPRNALAWGLLFAMQPRTKGSSLMPDGLKLYRAAMTAQAGASDSDRARAADLMGQLLNREPANDHVRYAMAQAFERAGDHEAAINLQRELWEGKGPFAVNAGNDLAYLIAEHQPENLSEAARIAERAYKADPGSPFILDTLGWIEFKRGGESKAIDYLSAAILSLNDSADVHEHLGQAYGAIGNRSWKKYHLEQAETLRRSDD